MTSLTKYLLALSLLNTGINIIGNNPIKDNRELSKVNDTEPELQFDLYRKKNNDVIFYTAALTNTATLANAGSVTFEFNKKTKQGLIRVLHINQSARKKSFGSMLLQFALDTLTECDCSEIHWTASPFDLPAGINAQDMLPKLIAFYERHGAQVLSKTAFNAQMFYSPKTASMKKKN